MWLYLPNMKYKSLIILSYFWLQTLNQIQKSCNICYYFFSLARFWRLKPSKIISFSNFDHNSLLGEFWTIKITCCWNIYSMDGNLQIISGFQILSDVSEETNYLSFLMGLRYSLSGLLIQVVIKTRERRSPTRGRLWRCRH